MKQREVYMLDEDDGKAVHLFVKLGMPKSLAKTLLYISQFDECQSADIEQGADLRQPEVSLAIMEMRRRGWIKKRDLKKKGKGRPLHIYKSATNPSEILKAFEQEKIQEIEGIKKDLSELKTIFKSRKILTHIKK